MAESLFNIYLAVGLIVIGGASDIFLDLKGDAPVGVRRRFLHLLLEVGAAKLLGLVLQLRDDAVDVDVRDRIHDTIDPLLPQRCSISMLIIVE